MDYGRIIIIIPIQKRSMFDRTGFIAKKANKYFVFSASTECKPIKYTGMNVYPLITIKLRVQLCKSH